jgi:hypothetical protein
LEFSLGQQKTFETKAQEWKTNRDLSPQTLKYPREAKAQEGILAVLSFLMAQELAVRAKP